MADAIYNQSATGFSQQLWNTAIFWPYREDNVFDAVAVAKSTTYGGTRGKSVTHTFVNDLPLATTPIDEIIGPDSVVPTSSTKTFTLKEYAQTMRTTALARTTGFVDLDSAVVNWIGTNAGQSMDALAATALNASTNIQYANGKSANSGILATDVLTTNELEIAATELRVQSVPKINGFYNLYAHPYQIHDLRQDAKWRDARTVGGNDFESLRQRVVGYWADFRIIETTREPFAANVGSPSTVDVYSAIAIGADALAKSYSDHPEAPGAMPEVRFGLAVDALGRNKPVSWYHLTSYDILRSASVRKINTAASRGANAA